MNDIPLTAQSGILGPIVWGKSPTTDGSDRRVLLGARIKSEWLAQSVSLLAVRFVGPLELSLRTLLDVANSKEEKALPIVRLRSALMAKLEDVVRLDRHLGLRNAAKPAMELRRVFAGDATVEDFAEVSQQVVDIMKRWHLDVIGPWAERNGLSEAAAPMFSSIAVENVNIHLRNQGLIDRGPGGQVLKPQFDLIAKHLAERLVGEELFPGLGPCELVASAASLDGAVELTTWPTQVDGSDSVFSMVARLSVATWPTSKELYLKIVPVKRVWAAKVPGRKPNAPNSVTCYIFSPSMPVLPALVRRNKDGWEFGDEYIQYRMESAGELPESMADAIADLIPKEGGWWVGLPELTTLFDFVRPRTVFESDEIDLYDQIVELLPDALDGAMPCRVLKMNRAMNQPKSEVARLQVDDVLPPDASDLGWAGAALTDEIAAPEGSDELAVGDDVDNESRKEGNRRDRLARHRSANEEALLRIHGDKTPSLWIFVDGTDERNIIERSARAIFGERLRLEFAPLPFGVHGLRDALDEPGEKGIRRFDARVARWTSAACQVAEGADGAQHVLICAPKDVNRRPEDPVNYFAGLHAMCHYGKANVHHLLPLEIDRRTQKLDVQHFIHRVQSALLDVFLAHSGVVFGVQPFVTACLSNAEPKAIYGLQVVRSQARAFTQEQPVHLILFSRLDIASGMSSVRFVCRNKNRIQVTDWEPLNEGLRWLGSQRQLSGDDRWVREYFGEAARKMLGQIYEADPRAVVLVDWSTVAGLWKEITDDALTSGDEPKVMLDGANLGIAFPSMTILRLRSDRNATMAIRWVNATTFEEWRTEPQLERTRKVTEAHYATTYKTIVELDVTSGERRHPHYLMVMGYRSTVQTKRGMSCYRPMWRMAKNASGWYERRTLQVAKDNAALPSGLEVTVLQAPKDVLADNLARLVMGLRLGYAHYDDWTALPAPLFFISKVRDYIIRYPDVSESGGDDAPYPSPVSPDISREALEADANASRAAELRSELVAEVLEALPGLAPLNTVAAETANVEYRVREEDTRLPSAESSLAVSPPDESTLKSSASNQSSESLTDPDLDRALKAVLVAPELYSPKYGPVARKLYEDMLLGNVRVRVDLPWFATRDTILSRDAWPTDKRAIGEYWRQLGKFHIRLRPERGAAPSIAQFPDWVFRRLCIPQSLYALDIAGVFPSSERIFYQVDNAYDAYRKECNEGETDPARRRFWQQMPEFVQWLCAKKDDEALGWVFCGLAHFPYRATVPDVLRAIAPEALGPRARLGLEYMSNCYEVCRKALDEKGSGNRKVGVHVISMARRPDAVSEVVAKPFSDEETQEAIAVWATPQSPTSSAKQVSAPFEHSKTPIAKAVEALGRAGSDLQQSKLAPLAPADSLIDSDWPVPGTADFDANYQVALQRLAELKRRHDEVLADQAEVQRIKEQEAARVSLLGARIAALNEEVRALALTITPDLEVGAWRAVDVRKVSDGLPSESDLESVQAELHVVRAATEEAAAAARHLELVDSGQFDGADLLGVKEKAKRKAPLLQAAAQRASDSEAKLRRAIAGCRMLVGDQGQAATDWQQSITDELPSQQQLPAESPPSMAASLPIPVVLASFIDVRHEDREVVSVISPSIDIEPPVVRDEPELTESPSDGVPNEELVAAVEDDEERSRAPVGPVDLLEPALQTTLACIQSGRWALADVASRALAEIESSPLSRLWTAAVSAIRSTHQRQPIDPVTIAALEDWLVAQNADHMGANTFSYHLGVLGASLLPMLLENNERGIRWAAIQYLKPRLQQFPELHRLLDRIASLESIHLDITPEMMSAARVGLHQALEDGIRRMRQRAENWARDSALVTNWTANDYRELHAAMFSEKRGFAMAECVACIARGQNERARILLPEVLKLADKGLATISDLRKRIGRRKPIEGVGRDYLTSNLKITAEFVQDYFEQLARLERNKKDSLPPKHKDFLQGLYRELQAAKAFVTAVSAETIEGAIHRSLALQAIDRALALIDQIPEGGPVSDEDQLLLVEHPMGRDLQPVLYWRATDDTQTRVPVGEIGALVDAVARVERDLGQSHGDMSTLELQKLLVVAAHSHRASARLLPARMIEERMTRLMKSPPASLVAENDAAQRDERSKLSIDLQEAKQRVTNAMSLNALPQAEASRMLKVIESLVRANAAQDIGATNRVGSLYADYPQARAVLQHLVLTPLDTKIQKSREQLEREIFELLQERRQLNLDPGELRQLEQKAQFIRERLAQDTALSVRVARNEFLLLREDKLPLLRFEEKTVSHRFDEFRAQVRKVTQGHRVLDGLHDILAGIAPTLEVAPDWLTSLSASEKAEAAEFIDHWICLFKSRPRTDFSEPLQKFFHGVGVAQQPTMLHRNDGKFFFDAKAFVGLGASGFGVFVPPALGSDARHIEGLIVPQPTSVAQLGQSISQLPAMTPTFMLSRQTLTLQERAQLGRDHPILLIDDDLVAYMAAHPAGRLAKLMEVCLLSFYTNPYADYGARPVPPEMFFGRKGELRKLREVPSAAVLYGGRRLGKSSLLNQILEESKNNVRLVPNEVGNGEMAVYVPLDSRSDPAGFSQNYRLFSWKAIHKALVTSGFLKRAQGELDTDQAIRDRIHDEIMAGHAATNGCYLLIDEADEVMREDLQGDAPFLANLQNLSETVLARCKLRYVIAGLHNLTRMTTEGNTALGKATSIALQPFSSDTDILNGIDLIMKPLAALGFLFGKGDENLPMRIMAVCNFYPAFIQLYCRNLVNRLYNKRASKELPTMIGSADLDAVERDQEFLQEIQEKFGLNLNLDKRYKAIALILAEYSYAEPAGSVFAGLTTSEVRDHCIAYAPEHFKTTAPGVYEALLDEMEKLTILERSGSRYQLRTPDIATMLGDKDQVSHHLEELAREKPTEARSRGEGRLVLRQKLDIRTFPMPSAWVRNYLQGDTSELVVFVGNYLSGISTFERLRDDWDIGQDDASIEGRAFNSPEDARTWANKSRKLRGARIRLVAVMSRSWHLDQLDTYAGVAQTFGKQSGQVDPSTKARMSTMRPILVASPDQAFGLAGRLCDKNAPVLRNLVIAPIPAWSDDAIYFRLDHDENQVVRDSAQARQSLMNATCGFGEELDRLCTPSLTIEEALRQPDESRKRLTSDLDAFYSKLGMPAVIDKAQRSRLEDLLMLMHGERRAESKELELLDGLELKQSHFLFAQWMSLVQPTADGSWEVPSLYLDLIEARPNAAT